ncbi:MAG: metallopeptidase TldD-related protein [Vulcanimicrobiota bacterium]
MGTALRRCRDAEIAWEERTEIDLAEPDFRRESRGWGLRVNLEGKLGWAWGNVDDTPEHILEAAVHEARNGEQEGILFSHGLPFSGQQPNLEPVNTDPHLHQLTQLVGRLQFLIPSLLPDRPVSIRAGLRVQQLCLVTRSGEQISQRVVYQLGLHTTNGAPLSAGLVMSRLRSSPAEILCQLAWRAAHSKKVVDASPGEAPAVWTEAATAALLRDLTRTHFDAANFLNTPDLAAPWGEAWLNPRITIQDDGTLPAGPGTVPFDGEGLARKPVALVQDGVVHHHLADRLNAKALGVDPPGLAVREWARPPRPGWSNLAMLGGRSSFGELSRKVGDGILLDHLVPCNAPCEPGEFCRLAEIAFRLKGGRPAERLAPFLVKARFTDLLGPGLIDIGNERSWNHRCFTPPLATARVTIEPVGGAQAEKETPGTWW